MTDQNRYISTRDQAPAEEGLYDCLIHRAMCVCVWKKGRWEGVYDQSLVYWKPHSADATELDRATDQRA